MIVWGQFEQKTASKTWILTNYVGNLRIILNDDIIPHGKKSDKLYEHKIQSGQCWLKGNAKDRGIEIKITSSDKPENTFLNNISH